MRRTLALSVLVLAAGTTIVAVASLADAGRLPGISQAPPRALLVAASGSLPHLASALPGSEARGELTVANRGGLRARVVLELSAGGSAALRGALVVSVTRAGRVLYAGPPRAVQRLDLGVLGRSELQRLRVRVALPAGAGNAVQGRTVSLGASFVAVAA